MIKVHCKYDELVDPKKLKNYNRNRNKHPQSQIDRLARLYEFHGIRHPIIVDIDRQVIAAGHGRKLAAIRAGIKEFPVVYQKFETDEALYTFVQSDNAATLESELDMSGINLDLGELGPFDIDSLGIPDFKVDRSEKDDELGDPDEIPEVKEPKAKLGQIYQLGNHRLMCGDSTDPENISILFDGKNAELCFTSPPYSDQRNYNGGKDLSTQKLAQFITAAKDSCAYFAVNLGYQRKDGEVYPYWDDYINEAKKSGFKFLSWNIWNKGECGSIGNQTAMFGISHEWIFVFGPETKDLNRTIENKNGGHWNNHSSIRNKDGSITKGKNRFVRSHSQLKTVYDCVPQKSRDEIDHPARFPVEFPVGYIEAFTAPNECVYEPFGGSGTTLIACEKTNRKCFMMELDPHYIDVIIARWEKYTGQAAKLLTD